MKKTTFRAAVLAAMVLALVAPSTALIDPNTTLVELVSQSRAIWRVRVSRPDDGQLKAEVVDALVGEAPADKALVLDTADAQDLDEEKLASTFGEAAALDGVLLVRKEKRDGATVASLQIGSLWLGLTQTDGKGRWTLDADPDNLETVWGASARLLVPAIRYVTSTAGANFPVEAHLTWADEAALGTLTEPATGCVVTPLGVAVLSTGGDRMIAPGEGGAAPTDVTARLGLATRSKALTAGDFNADGRADLASWDGARVRLAVQKADGTLAAPTDGLPLDGVVSLVSLGDRLAAARADGLVLLTVKGPGLDLEAKALAAPADAASLGAAGAATAADLDGDGRVDLVQAYEKGLAVYAGAADGTMAAATVVKVPVVESPRAIVCGDYDTDGRLDLMVAGKGATLLSRDAGGAWRAAIAETGELGVAVRPDQAQSVYVDAAPADLNGDGRQSVTLLAPDMAPGLFFNRGFACFGIARQLGESGEDLESVAALSSGQQAGTMVDLNGDASPDLLAVDSQRRVWAVLSEPDQLRRLELTVALKAPSAAPVTVTAVRGDVALGMWVVRPGRAAVFGVPRAGPVVLTWTGPEGTKNTRTLVVTRPLRAEL